MRRIEIATSLLIANLAKILRNIVYIYSYIYTQMYRYNVQFQLYQNILTSIVAKKLISNIMINRFTLVIPLSSNFEPSASYSIEPATPLQRLYNHTLYYSIVLQTAFFSFFPKALALLRQLSVLKAQQLNLAKISLCFGFTKQPLRSQVMLKKSLAFNANPGL